MDPQGYPILMSLSKMIDELCKIIAKGNDKHQAKASALPAEPQTVDGKSDIGGLKATRAVLMKDVETMRDDWLKAMESFYAVQECLLTLCLMANLSNPNLSTPHNVQGFFSLPVLLTKMKEELGQRIAEEKAAQFAEMRISAVAPEVTDEISDTIDALKSENAALKSELEALGDGWLSMNAACFAFVKNLVDIGLIMAPSEGIYPSQG